MYVLVICDVCARDSAKWKADAPPTSISRVPPLLHRYVPNPTLPSQLITRTLPSPPLLVLQSCYEPHHCCFPPLTDACYCFFAADQVLIVGNGVACAPTLLGDGFLRDRHVRYGTLDGIFAK